jgi:hypothetical protein
VVVVIGAAHQIVAFAEQTEGLFADRNATLGVEYTGLDHVGFGEIEEIDLRIHGKSFFNS